MSNWLAGLWCRKMHSGAMWPMHGRYVCPRCWREYAVEWEVGEEPEQESQSEAALGLGADRA